MAERTYTIGFDVASQEDFVALARVALEQGERVACPLGRPRCGHRAAAPS